MTLRQAQGDVSQRDRILEYLQQGNALTPLEALNKFQCLRLGARIWELRQAGYDIQCTIIETSTGKHVAEYRMKPKLWG